MEGSTREKLLATRTNIGFWHVGTEDAQTVCRKAPRTDPSKILRWESFAYLLQGRREGDTTRCRRLPEIEKGRREITRKII